MKITKRANINLIAAGGLLLASAVMKRPMAKKLTRKAGMVALILWGKREARSNQSKLRRRIGEIISRLGINKL